MLAFDKAREINFIGPLGPPHTTFVEVACAIGLLHHFFVQEFADKLSIVALSDRVAKILPRESIISFKHMIFMVTQLKYITTIF